MASMTREQYKKIRQLTRAAQRRMERATPGHRKAMEYNVQRMTGAPKWSSAAKGFTYQEAQAQIAKLTKFMESDFTTKTGWKILKEENVKAAQKTLSERYKGFFLTDAELAEIFKQVTEEYNPTDEELALKHITRQEAIKQEKYRAINLVTAAAYKKGELVPMSSSEIRDAIHEINKITGEQISAEAAYRRALNARKKMAQQGDFSKYMSNADIDIPF